MILGVVSRIEAIFEAAFAGLGLQNFPIRLEESVRPEFGDYQINGVLAAARALGRAPRELAMRLVEMVGVTSELAKVEVAGPGFINLWISNQWLLEELNRDNFAAYNKNDRVVVIDYSSPNLAKEMHVGHLRSTIIGDALVRIHQFMGDTVIKRNHIGDWGTQFGMLLAYMAEHKLSGEQLNLALSDLERFYRQAKLRFDQDEQFRDLAHQMVVQLQRKEPTVYELWQSFVKISMQHCQRIYHRLHVLLRPEDAVGESWYNDMLPSVVQDLLQAGIAVDDQGAKCVFFSPGELPQDSEAPFIIQKGDGAYLYATTDLAAAYDRIDHLRADELLYVIDARQSLHMQQLFATLKRRGKLNGGIRAEHVAFGVMLGEDGRPFRTRDGGTVHLASLLDEAQRRAEEQLRLRHSDWDDRQIESVGKVLAIAAIKYADLAKNRISDYKFSFEQMLAWEGNTAPYLLYAYVRARSVIRKLQLEDKTDMNHRVNGLLNVDSINDDTERVLVKLLLKWDAVLQQAADSSCPHLICSYLYQMATAFMRFYEHCPVQQAVTTIRSSRLVLVNKVASYLRQGLELLGIAVVEQM